MLDAVAATGAPGVHVFVSNVGFAQLVRGPADYSRRGLLRSIDYSAWPLAAYPLAIQERFGALPRYVVAMTSAGPDELHPRYDFAAAAKAVLETLVRYLAYRWFDTDTRVNAVRTRLVPTESLRATVGDAFEPFMRRLGGGPTTACPACSPSQTRSPTRSWPCAAGCWDGMSGQVLTVDHGVGFSDTLMRLFEDRHAIRSEPRPPADPEAP